MAIFEEMFNVPGMSKEENDYLRKQQLLKLSAALMQASSPSTDPRHGSLAYVLSQGLQGMTSGKEDAMGQLAAAHKFKQLKEEENKKQLIQEAIKKIPKTELVPNTPDFGTQATAQELPGIAQQMYRENPEALKEYFTKEQPRALTNYLQDVIRAQSTVDPLAALEGAKDLSGYIKALKGEETKPVAGVQEFEMVTGTPATLRGTPEYEKKYKNWKRETAEMRGEAFASTRGGQYLDIKTGRVRPVSWSEINKNPEQFIGTQDPSFAAWKNNVNYQRMSSNFVNTIDRYSKMATNIMTKYRLNQDPKLLNYGIQDLIKLKGMGSGEVAALNQILAGLQQEIAKVESGQLGIAAPQVETAKKFGQGLNPNMPMKDLLIVFDWAKKAGKERIAGINDETKRLRAETLGEEYTPPEESKKLTFNPAKGRFE